MTETRNPFDPHKLNAWVKENALNAFHKKINGLETDHHQLRVKYLHYKDKGIETPDIYDAILNRKDVTNPLYGTYQLVDKRTGKVTAEKTAIIAHVPHVTHRNTIVYGGSEYVPFQQIRLSPGAYSRIQKNGLLTTQMNPKNGMSLNVHFNPETSQFTLQAKTANVHLYSLLKELGVPDERMEKTWGKEIFNKNRAKYSEDSVGKLHDILYRIKR